MWTIIFDLDQTLLAPVKRKRSDFTIRVPSVTQDYPILEKHIKLRPGTQELLQYCTEHFHVAIWSMAQPSYVQAIADYLFPTISPDFVYNWTHCYREGYRVYKKLADCPSNLQETYIIDDRLEIIYEPDHCFTVSAYYGSSNDRELYRIQKKLAGLLSHDT